MLLSKISNSCIRKFSEKISRNFSTKASLMGIMPSPPTLITKLSNGIRVASEKTFDETITVGVWVDSGSRYENKYTNGAAHFLEHMTFKGTQRRSRIQLEQEIENMGAHLNAYTAREQTVYYAKTFPKDLKQTIDILSDILINSEIDEYAMEIEKHVVLREMQEVEKATEEVIFDKLHIAAFKDDPLGFTILGPIENIKNMQRQHLVDYIAKNYTAERMVVAAAGNVDHKELTDLAEKYFKQIKPANKTMPKQPLMKPKFFGSECICRNDSMGPVVHVALAFEGVSWKSPDAILFMLMQSIIGSYRKGDENLMPGRLSNNNVIKNIANKMNGECNEMFSSFNTCYSDTGLFGFYIQSDVSSIDSCITELMYSIPALSYTTTNEDVQRAKLHLKTQLLGSLDTTTAIAEDIGRQLLVYGRRIPLNEFLTRLDAISAEDIRRAAWKYFHNSEAAIVGLGQIRSFPQYKDLKKNSYGFAV